MAVLNIAPTKSNLLSLKQQLRFAEEGYDLLEQKRQMLVFELMSRLPRVQKLEREVTERLRSAFSASRAATFESGSETVDRAALGVKSNDGVRLQTQHLMGIRLPKIVYSPASAEIPFGIGGTSAKMDVAARGFYDLLPKLAELAELQNSVIRLARELRKTQRRCNALSKLFIPTYRNTIAYIAGTLEERERESLTILKMIRDRLSAGVDHAKGNAAV